MADTDTTPVSVTPDFVPYERLERRAPAVPDQAATIRDAYRLPPGLAEDIERFAIEVERFVSGAASTAEFRAFRVPQGVYEEREDGRHMIRLRPPAGVLDPDQLRTIAKVSHERGNGVAHVTTRHGIQVHGLALEDLQPALVELFGAALFSRGGGGNTVRNVTVCGDAGICADEAFDVTPYAVGVSDILLADPLSYRLPRKYKIAFSGCSRDCSGATVNDLGFIARQRGDEQGFAVYVGGGLGANSRVGQLLEEFVPAEQVGLVAEAIKRVFDRYGNRRNKHRVRLRFLVERLGMEEFKARYCQEIYALRGVGVPRLPERRFPAPLRPGGTAPSGEPPAEGFAAWRSGFVMPQRQLGFHRVRIPLWLGRIPRELLERLAELVEAHGEGLLRATREQGLALRWVREDELPDLHRKLSALGLAASGASALKDVIACAGASTCRLGLCRSRGLADAVAERLRAEGAALDGAGAPTLRISGCPDACGHHPIGNIGLIGAARRVNRSLVPQYVVQLGGRVAEGETRLAEGNEAIPARNVPDFLVELLKAYRASAHPLDFDAFLDTDGGREVAAELISRYREPPAGEEADRDWGSDEPFSLAGRGPGECGAGVFDLIEVDLTGAREALERDDLASAASLAAGALLVTKGQEARDGAQALDRFFKHFLDAGLIGGAFRALIDRARQHRLGANDRQAVGDLIDAVHALYDGMDDSLRFPGETAGAPAADPEGSAAVESDREVDLWGVACPLNYVKTKMLLDRMAPGDVLTVILNDAGFRNVPDSVRHDGHEVLSVTESDGRYRAVIRRR